MNMPVSTDKKPIKSSEQIIEAARALAAEDRRRTVAVAGAQDGAVMSALAQANADGILNAALFGDKAKIEEIAAKENIDISKLDVIHEADAAKATYGAVKTAAEGSADIIMKGFVSTSTLLKTVLAKEFNLRTKNTISHCAVLDIPGYDKLLSMTDGGMVVEPDRDQKRQILENAVYVSKALGISPVRVAVSGAVDKVYDDIPASKEAAEFVKEMQAKNYPGVEIQGPLTFDAATSEEIAAKKKIGGPVAGRADIYLVGSIEECNIIAKALINFIDAVFAGVIVGARVPVSLVSRTDTITNKKASVSIACLLAAYYEQTGGFGQ
jgi:phosphate butyryltransferase